MPTARPAISTAKPTPTEGDSPPAPSAAPSVDGRQEDRERDRELRPSGRSFGRERLELRLDRLGLGARARYPRAIAASRGSDVRRARCVTPRRTGLSARARSAFFAALSVRRRHGPRARSRNARAAASGSAASVRIARTTTIGSPRPRTILVHVALAFEAADREPAASSRCSPRGRRSPGPAAGRPGLGRRDVHGPDREVVDVDVRLRGRRLVRRVRRAADDASGPRRAPSSADRRPGRRGCRRRRTRRPGPAGRRGQERVVADEGLRRAPRQRVVVQSVLSRSWIRSTPPRTAAAFQSRGQRGAAEVQGGAALSSSASPIRGYHEPQNTGARSRAERAPPGRRPSNLIRLVPA